MLVAVLCDVDLTLLDARRSGSKALARAFADLWGWEDALRGVSMAGRTDLAIVSGVIESRMGWRPSALEMAAHLKRLREAYLALLAGQLEETPAVPCPGIPALLDRIPGMAGMEPGLATGNFEAGAVLKLRSAALDPARFPYGAFGDTCPTRAGMVGMAIEEARRHAGSDVVPVVLGDTPLDLEAARSSGAWAALVSTGSFSFASLAALCPDFLAPSLEDPAPFLAWLGEIAGGRVHRATPGA